MFRPIESLLRTAAVAAALAHPAGAETPLRSLQTADANRGWEAVGRLNFGIDGFCTAALITPDVVLTAAHCLFDPVTGDRIEPAEIEFQPGLRNGRAEAYRGVRRVVVHPAYDYAAEVQLDRVRVDLALLQLDRPIRLGHVRPFGTQARAEVGQTVQVVSYGWNRADAPSYQSACAVLARDADILVLDCDVDFGSSGAPVFARYGAETRIVSVVSAKARWEGQTVSLAAVMEHELDILIGAFGLTPIAGSVGKRIAVTGAVDALSAN